MLPPALTYGPLIAIGEQRPGGARDGPACRLHLRVRPHRSEVFVVSPLSFWQSPQERIDLVEHPYRLCILDMLA